MTATDRQESGLDLEEVSIVLIAAVAENGIIGKDGDMPWHYPADLKHFKETTVGHPVVMGRRTYESIVEGLGTPLPGRTNIVLTTQTMDAPGGVVIVDSIPNAIEAAREALSDGGEAIYVVGGATVYEQFLPMADRLVLTEIARTPDGDTSFPTVDWSAWKTVERDEHDELTFVTYERT